MKVHRGLQTATGLTKRAPRNNDSQKGAASPAVIARSAKGTTKQSLSYTIGICLAIIGERGFIVESRSNFYNGLERRLFIIFG